MRHCKIVQHILLDLLCDSAWKDYQNGKDVELFVDGIWFLLGEDGILYHYAVVNLDVHQVQPQDARIHQPCHRFFETVLPLMGEEMLSLSLFPAWIKHLESKGNVLAFWRHSRWHSLSTKGDRVLRDLGAIQRIKVLDSDTVTIATKYYL